MSSEPSWVLHGPDRPRQPSPVGDPTREPRTPPRRIKSGQRYEPYIPRETTGYTRPTVMQDNHTPVLATADLNWHQTRLYYCGAYFIFFRPPSTQQAYIQPCRNTYNIPKPALLSCHDHFPISRNARSHLLDNRKCSTPLGGSSVFHIDCPLLAPRLHRHLLLV